MNDDGAGNGVNLSGYAVSPLITVPTDMNAITFQYFFIDGDYNGDDETAKVLVSTDGVNFAEIANLAQSTANGNVDWTDGFASVADYAGMEVYIAFGYDDGQGWNYGFCIDDIAFDNVESNCANLCQIVSSFIQLCRLANLCLFVTSCMKEPNCTKGVNHSTGSHSSHWCQRGLR